LFYFIPVSGYVISLMENNLKKTIYQSTRRARSLLSTIEETLGGSKKCKGYNSENYFNTLSKNQHNAFFKPSSIGKPQT
jgi:subfamily B ATP-binding cassette protein MsbA